MKRFLIFVAIGLALAALHHYNGRHVSFSDHPRITMAPEAGRGSQVEATSVSASEAAQGPALSGLCAQELPYGRGPAFQKASYAQSFTVLCYTDMVVGYSGLTRTPLWSAERLDAGRVVEARHMIRVNPFHAESRLPEQWQAQLSDYARSGYDRGHLSPNGDMPNASTQFDSFTLANIAPQNPGLNRGPWAELESAVRDRAQNVPDAPLYVITGVLFEGQTIGFLKDRVGVPTYFYKFVYDPKAAAASVYIAPNQEGGTVSEMTVAAFEQAHGISFDVGNVRPLSFDLSHYHSRYH